MLGKVARYAVFGSTIPLVRFCLFSYIAFEHLLFSFLVGCSYNCRSSISKYPILLQLIILISAPELVENMVPHPTHSLISKILDYRLVRLSTMADVMALGTTWRDRRKVITESHNAKGRFANVEKDEKDTWEETHGEE